MLDDLATVVHVDPSRIFATGMSNGGMMCHRLAAELADRIAAVAPVGGTLALADIKPSRPVPVMHFHGSDDRIVPVEGPNGRTPPTMKFRSVAQTIDAWRKVDGCAGEAKTIDIPDTAGDGTTVRITTYAGAKGDAEVVLVMVQRRRPHLARPRACCGDDR